MKQIRSITDLAINGAPPAFSQALHVGRPNIGDHAAMLDRTAQVLQGSWLTNNGPMVRELEARIAAMLGVRHCVAMCNGTIALEIAIRALRLEGEVIVPSWTFIATAHALHWQGITPVFADVDPHTHCLDPSAVERMITPRTSGVIGVHLWGRPSPAVELAAVADKHGLALLFDAAHAFGCSKDGLPIGGLGRCEVFSFHATKVFNTFEGGAVCTNDNELAEAMRLMRNFGFRDIDDVIHPGTNGKMPEINAAMGLINLDALPSHIDANRLAYERYLSLLDDNARIEILRHQANDTPNYQYVVLQVCDEDPTLRDRIIKALQAENVLARKYFWPGCHRMKPYRDLYPHAGMLLPNTELVAARNIVLPTGSGIDAASAACIASVISQVCAAR